MLYLKFIRFYSFHVLSYGRKKLMKPFEFNIRFSANVKHQYLH